MDTNALIKGIRGRDEEAVRELIRARGTALFTHAMALCEWDKPLARTLVSETFRNAIAHMRAFPEERLDDARLANLLDAELVEAVHRHCIRSASGGLTNDAVVTLRSKRSRIKPTERARPKTEKRAIIAFQTVALIILAIAALWLMCGILMSMGWMPYVDLGYTWFNRTVLEVF
ncbi:MAG TPA: hypothetical protein VN540_04665 [Clostridia bacterium]|nr:hypothetical protein [Clostridia bacterium]